VYWTGRVSEREEEEEEVNVYCLCTKKRTVCFHSLVLQISHYSWSSRVIRKQI